MRPKLPAAERREVVAELTVAGMSTRAIASTLGVSHQTVANDREATGVKELTPETRGLDGKTYTRNPITPGMRQAADELARPDPFAGMTPQQREEIAARAVDLKHWNELVGDILSALAGAKDRRRVPEDLPETFPTLATAIELAHQLIETLEGLNG
jgi:transposase-like protein